MKSEPTDIDRKAAQLFALEPGMMAMPSHSEDGFGRVITNRLGRAKIAFVVNPTRISVTAVELELVGIDALDTDDEATKGIMLAQVTEAGRLAGLLSRFDGSADSPWQSFDVLYRDETGETVIDNGSCRTFCAVGTSLAAALVAAMRALKGKA